MPKKFIARGPRWAAEVEGSEMIWAFRVRPLHSTRWDEGNGESEAHAKAMAAQRLGEQHLLGFDELIRWVEVTHS